ncbi:hypothetical protein HNP38_001005 [Chryseobacterium defluvii]|uniref:Carboxypeptidase regulatory-like domain-containing protein n=1 Tax=Chryseobacterium defluvii TaxID=160396 RepID=A0A840KDV9_9FLAO|nr:hypothetical protein [Chryseobacterium defluvii]MBB4805733.1 hypothetical protein [Chryseobacterium defluvii]
MFIKHNSKNYRINHILTPTDNLINGILQLTVFDDKENIIAQRLCFVQPELLKIQRPVLQEISLNKKPRELNSFNITNNYTVLVQDPEIKSSEEENNLLSRLWLTGDITSNIIKPAQYFIKNHNSEALDALLISEKWKRFDWKNIISGIYPVIKYPADSSYITYKAKVMINNQPAVNASLSLIFDIPEFGSKFYEIQTDENGNFTLSGMIFEDNMKLSYQLNKEQKMDKRDFQVFFQPNYAFIPYKNNLPKSKFNLTKRLSEDALSPEEIRSIATKNTQKFISEKITDIEEVKIKTSKSDKLKILEKN